MNQCSRKTMGMDGTQERSEQRSSKQTLDTGGDVRRVENVSARCDGRGSHTKVNILRSKSNGRQKTDRGASFSVASQL